MAFVAPDRRLLPGAEASRAERCDPRDAIAEDLPARLLTSGREHVAEAEGNPSASIEGAVGTMVKPVGGFWNSSCVCACVFVCLCTCT